MSDEPPGWDELFGDAFPEDDDERGEDAPPTPGERLLYALGQLRRLHLRRRLPLHPSAFDVEDLACVIAVADQLEFVSEDRNGKHYHFPNEVLYMNPQRSFPWRLLSVWEWAAEQELNSYWAEEWDLGGRADGRYARRELEHLMFSREIAATRGALFQRDGVSGLP